MKCACGTADVDGVAFRACKLINAVLDEAMIVLQLAGLHAAVFCRGLVFESVSECA